MKIRSLSAAIFGGCILAAFCCSAATDTTALDPSTNHAAAPAAASEDKERASLEKHARPILQDLKIEDAAKQASVRDTLFAWFAASKVWHEKNDAQLKDLWNQFNAARSKQDQPKADEIMGQIDKVYATFKPQHVQFVSTLADSLTPDQIERVKDLLTINKVNVTYKAYGEIFHGLKDDQKAFILNNLKSAREEAIDAGSMTEKSAFFKKYKIKIEAYLTAQGYDVKQSYKDFVAKQKAEMAAKKGAGSTDPAAKSQAEEQE